MRKCLTLALLFVSVWCAKAQKTVYIPEEWRVQRTDTLLYSEEDPDGLYTWSKTRSRETENVIVFWDKYYTKDPDKLAKSNFYYVDIDDLLQKCEAFYKLEINELGFVDPEKSNLSKYKVMVLMNHTQDWTCYGGGYDFQISALWLNPSTCKPVGHSVAHEIGHSFHYMCFAEHNSHCDSDTDNTGFHLACGNGQAVWEQTAQWQANQSYPEYMFSQSYPVFRNSHNYAFSHEWHRYQSYWFFYFLCQHYQDLTAVAQVWNQPMTGQTRGNGTDFNQALMGQRGLKDRDLFQLYYDYAAHCATWDFDVCEPYRNAFIGDFHYAAVLTGDRSYQVAYESAPQATGFNVIPLDVPEAGTEVKAIFTSLAPGNNTRLANGDPGLYLNGETQWVKSNRSSYYSTGKNAEKGFRLGYVALMQDGTRQYFQVDSVYCQGSKNNQAQLSMTVPEGVQRLWMIVSPAPSRYYQHKWDEKPFVNDDAWPYQLSFEGTDIKNSLATIYVAPELDGRQISDATFMYDVYLPKRNDYSPVVLTVGGSEAALLGTAFQMQPNDIAANVVPYSSVGPEAGKVMFYPVNTSTMKVVKRGSTANGLGHWFNASGSVSEYASGYVYSEFTPASLTFNIGQEPARAKQGETYTIGQALVYNDGTRTATAYFVFRVHITDGQSGTELVEKTNAVQSVSNVLERTSDDRVYSLSGRPVAVPARGLYIQRGKIQIAR